MSDPLSMTQIAVAPKGEIMDYIFFNKRYTQFVGAINKLSERQDGYDVVVNDLVEVGLQRINDVLGPLLTELQEAAQAGFLIANAANQVPQPFPVYGQPIQFICNNAAFPTFTPTPYLLAVDDADPNNWTMLSTTSYNKTNGTLACIVVGVSPTAHAAPTWTISTSSGVWSAMMAMEQTATNAANQAVGANNNVIATVGTLNTLVATMQAGPVVSVSGKAGIVILQIADITGLVDALNGKASVASVTNAVNGAQPISAVLSALSKLNPTNNQLVLWTGPATCMSIACSSAAQQLLAAPDFPSMANLLGVGPTGIATQVAATPISTSQLQPQFDDKTGTAYTFVQADMNDVVTLTNTAAIGATLPNNLPKGWNCLVYQGGTGQITFTAQTGATLRNRLGQLKTAGQYSVVSLLCVSNPAGNNATFVLGGDTGP